MSPSDLPRATNFSLPDRTVQKAQPPSCQLPPGSDFILPDRTAPLRRSVAQVLISSSSSPPGSSQPIPKPQGPSLWTNKQYEEMDGVVRAMIEAEFKFADVRIDGGAIDLELAVEGTQYMKLHFIDVIREEAKYLGTKELENLLYYLQGVFAKARRALEIVRHASGWKDDLKQFTTGPSV
ncbi:uncharacterized protein RSE6_01541 [Rhynchosporium secalis]|uniref:Uncharacterized protein n=1 Tax=Rhynchosporium secalis TaxID=38038 RepID=A0A1E1LY49_RHYSE|nr:uncharacterized protein RSE6_01541 [Rhynchosporium secalis]